MTPENRQLGYVTHSSKCQGISFNQRTTLKTDFMLFLSQPFIKHSESLSYMRVCAHTAHIYMCICIYDIYILENVTFCLLKTYDISFHLFKH